jgi:hypothetical protein
MELFIVAKSCIHESKQAEQVEREERTNYGANYGQSNLPGPLLRGLVQWVFFISQKCVSNRHHPAGDDAEPDAQRPPPPVKPADATDCKITAARESGKPGGGSLDRSALRSSAKVAMP